MNFSFLDRLQISFKRWVWVFASTRLGRISKNGILSGQDG